MRILFQTTGLLVTLLISAISVLADTRLVFPRIVFQNGLFSGIAISNPTLQTATVKLTAYNPDGTKLAGAGIQNDVSSPAIPSGGQYLKLASQVFDPNSLLAGSTPKYYWVEVTSTTTGLVGFYIEGDGDITYQYGGDLGTVGTDLYLPAVENTATTVTEISLVNADTSGNGGIANVSVDFLKNDGQKVDSKNVAISQAASLQGPLATISAFNLPSFSQVAALRIHSDRPVLCHGIVKPQSGKTPIALPAVDATTPAKTLYFPQLVVGGGWATSIGIANLNPSAQVLVNITAYDKDGTLFVDSTITNPKSVTIPAGGFMYSAFRDLFPFTDTSYKEGWIQVDAPSPSINGFVEYNYGSNRALVIAQLNPFQLSMFSHQAQAPTCTGCPSYFTGLAMLNPGTLAANVEVFYLDSETGTTVGRKQTVLRPGQRTSELLYEVVKESDNRHGGTVFVRSDRPIFTTELFAKNEGDHVSALANVPPQLVTVAFDPKSSVPNISLSPQLAVIETGKTKQFSVSGTSGGIQWSVGGSASTNIGSISSNGLYTAPAEAPAPHTLTIKAEATNNSGASSVDVVKREQLTGGLTVITAVAYLDTLKRFFVAEQTLASPAPSAGFAATAASTQITEVVTSGGTATNVPYLPINGDTIAKMLPYDSGGTSYMLLAGRVSGKIYRLGVVGKDLKTVISGLNQPTSLALDPSTGNLLVAEAGAQQITIVTPAQIAAASAPYVAASAPSGSRRLQALPAPNIQGIAVDRCTGSVYVSDTSGQLVEYQGSSRRVVETGLDRPTQLQAVWRTGFSCSTALTIGIVEASKISLSFPRQQIPRVTLVDNIQGIGDVTFLSKGNPFTSGGEASVCISQSSTTPSQGQVSDVPMGGAFQPTPPETIDPLRRLYGGIGPNEDPIGDTFDPNFATRYGYAIPDIVSVTSSTQGDQSVITIKFVAPLVLLGPYEPGVGFDGLRAYVFIRSSTGPSLTSYPLNFPDYFPLSDPGTYVFDSYIWVSPGVGSGYVSVTGGFVVLKMSAVGDTLTFSLPTSALNLDRARAVVVVGNSSEITDVAPNNGLLSLSTIPLVYSIRGQSGP